MNANLFVDYRYRLKLPSETQTGILRRGAANAAQIRNTVRFYSVMVEKAALVVYTPLRRFENASLPCGGLAKLKPSMPPAALENNLLRFCFR